MLLLSLILASPAAGVFVTKKPPPIKTTLSVNATVSVTGDTTRRTLTIGQPADYTVTIVNNGPGFAQNINVAFNVDGAVIQGVSKACSSTNCQIGLLTPGQQVTVGIRIVPQGDGLLGVTATVPGPVGGIGKSSAIRMPWTAVAAPPPQPFDLSIDSNDAPSRSVDRGGMLSYSLTVRNAGPGTVTRPMLRMTVNGGTVDNPPPDCPNLRCVLGPLGPQESVTVTLNLRADANGLLTAEVGAATKVRDSDPGNNSITLQWAVLDQPQPGPVIPGDDQTGNNTTDGNGAGSPANGIDNGAVDNGAVDAGNGNSSGNNQSDNHDGKTTGEPSFPSNGWFCSNWQVGCDLVDKRDDVFAIAVLIGLVAVAAAAAVAYRIDLHRRHLHFMRIATVAGLRDDEPGVSIGRIPFAAPALVVSCRCPPAEAWPPGPIPIEKVESR